MAFDAVRFLPKCIRTGSHIHAVKLSIYQLTTPYPSFAVHQFPGVRTGLLEPKFLKVFGAQLAQCACWAPKTFNKGAVLPIVKNLQIGARQTGSGVLSRDKHLIQHSGPALTNRSDLGVIDMNPDAFWLQKAATYGEKDCKHVF